jgi:hypothetical protein
MRVLKNYILLALFTAAPIISVLAAEGIAAAYGSKVDEAGSHPCFIRGVDVGTILSVMFTAGWFALITIPVGCIAILVYTIKQVAGLFSRKKHEGS